MRRQAGEGVAVIAVAKSQNAKLGKASSTTVSIEGSCPTTCALRTSGCYARQGPLGWQTARMDRFVQESNLTPEAVAQAEADAIDGIWSGLPLRLHVAGDCKTDGAAQIVADAAGRYSERNRAPAWTYTHGWKDVARDSWKQVSVLASCETPEDAEQARARGYAVAMVVPEYLNGKRAWKADNGMTVLPCPEMTGAAASCTDCRLCMDDAKLRDRNVVIAFEVHGAQSKKAKLALQVLNG